MDVGWVEKVAVTLITELQWSGQLQSLGTGGKRKGCGAAWPHVAQAMPVAERMCLERN